MTWGATQAKAKFSEVLDRVETDGPQSVRRRKQEYFIMTSEQYHATLKTSNRSSLGNAWDSIRPSSGANFDGDFKRLSGKARAAKF